jgi:hypothetical protein
MTITPMIPTPPFLEFISISYPSAIGGHVAPHCEADLPYTANTNELVFQVHREAHDEVGAAARWALDPDVASHGAGERPAYEQSDPRPVDLASFCLRSEEQLK